MRSSAICSLLVLLVGANLLAQDTPEDEIEYRVLKFDDGFTVFEDGLTPRLRVRANFYRAKDDNPWHSSPGQVSIEYGLPKWKAEFEQAFADFPPGGRWRMGSNYWTNLSTSFPLSSAGNTLQAGYYYLVLERGAENGWKLIFLDPAAVRKLNIDPWHVNRQDSGSAVMAVDLKQDKAEPPTEALQIKIRLDDENPRNFVIEVQFGPNQLVSSALAAELK